MNVVADQIRRVVRTAKSALLNISQEEAARKASPFSWSKMEILGHLIDSASTNHQRFVRGAQNLAEDFPPYNQNRFVEVQKYNERNWTDMVEFFYQYNLHLAHVIDCLSEEALQNPCGLGSGKTAPIGVVIEDYLNHLKHHINKVIE